jgi:hypothetical protein
MKLAEWIIKYARWIIVVSVLIAVAPFVFFYKARIETDLKNFIPPDIPSRMDTRKIEEIFGGTDILLLMMEAEDILQPSSLERLKNLATHISRIKGIDKTRSVLDAKNMRDEDGILKVDPAIRGLLINEAEREQLRDDLRANVMVENILLSSDFRYAIIVGNLSAEANDPFVVKEVERIIRNFPGPEKIHRGGMPYIR